MKTFGGWLQTRLMNVTDDEQLYLLAKQPSSTISTFQGYEINGNTFYTFALDKKSTNQNRGVRFDAEDDNGNKVTYYGYIEEIWELDYGPNFKVPLFRCKWFNLKDGVQVDPHYGMTTVDLKNLGHEEGGPPPSNFNEAGRWLWWRGRTLGRHGVRGPASLPSQPTRALSPRFDYRDTMPDDDDDEYDDYSGDYYRARHDTPRADIPRRGTRAPRSPRAAVAIAGSTRLAVAARSVGRVAVVAVSPRAPATEVRTGLLSLPRLPRLASLATARLAGRSPSERRLPRRARWRPPLTHARGLFDEMSRCRAEGRRRRHARGRGRRSRASSCFKRHRCPRHIARTVRTGRSEWAWRAGRRRYNGRGQGAVKERRERLEQRATLPALLAEPRLEFDAPVEDAVSRSDSPSSATAGDGSTPGIPSPAASREPELEPRPPANKHQAAPCSCSDRAQSEK
ncbi:hypothetical protein QYE76_064080 [Lolium multiflorum]|uniref:DUF4216 domain-containing protein n=1 Tax=Lolium multiflorum TaxID=4521 RepID=A0AAD8S894_LOLMU|nr:hypothetical protein QYE76_064080 [Lolium multiflorum]